MEKKLTCSQSIKKMVDFSQFNFYVNLFKRMRFLIVFIA